MSVISYPIPLYQNLPIRAEDYQPRRFFISAISLGLTTTVTTTLDMNYVVGQEIRLIIPPPFGCRQLNGQTGFVIEMPSLNSVIVSIDSSTNVDPFILSSYTTKAQILAIGDVNTGYVTSTGPYVPLVAIPGSFINISPQ
jgi:hypothetical protein